MLLGLAYLGVRNAVALLGLLPGGDRDKDMEIQSLRHQLAVVRRHLGGRRVRFTPADRAWLAALLHRLPRPTLRGLRLLVGEGAMAGAQRRTSAPRAEFQQPHRAAGTPAGPSGR